MNNRIILSEIINKVLMVFCSLLIAIALISTSYAVDVTLAWDANTDSAVAGYKIYHGLASRTYVTSVDAGKSTQLKLTNLPDGKTTYFAVIAYDNNRNESEYSLELVCYTLIPSVFGPGTITPSVPTMVSAVYPMTFIITSLAGAILSDVLVDGVSVGKVSSHLFTNVTANHTIKAVFVLPLPAIKGLRISQ